MATTSLKIKAPDGSDTRLSFMTSEAGEKIMLVNIYKTDEDFNPVGTASVSVSEHASEEEYHRELRKQASEKGHFVPDYSTNPEWNPDYKPQDDDHEFQGDLY